MGHQDLAANIARQDTPGAESRPQLLASLFGRIHAPKFNLPQLVGTGQQDAEVRPVAFDPQSDVTGKIALGVITWTEAEQSAPELIRVDRSRKGSRLVPPVTAHFDSSAPGTGEVDDLPAAPQSKNSDAGDADAAQSAAAANADAGGADRPQPGPEREADTVRAPAASDIEADADQPTRGPSGAGSADAADAEPLAAADAASTVSPPAPGDADRPQDAPRGGVQEDAQAAPISRENSRARPCRPSGAAAARHSCP